MWSVSVLHQAEILTRLKRFDFRLSGRTTSRSCCLILLQLSCRVDSTEARRGLEASLLGPERERVASANRI